MSSNSVRVLVIDDSCEIVELLAQLLEKENCLVATASTGEAGLRLFETFMPQILLCDVVLPDANGMDICRHVRQRDAYCQVLMLSALKEEFDKVLGLELGADDYITKPFSSRELRSRVRAAIRRLALFALPQAETDGETSGDPLEVEDLRISQSSRQLWRSDREISLTRKEFDLLLLLAENRGRVYSREALRETLWRNNPEINERSVDAQVRRLREKIEANLESPRYIETVRGSGYRFRPRD